MKRDQYLAHVATMIATGAVVISVNTSLLH